MNEAFPEAFVGVVDKQGSVENAGFWDGRTWSWKMMINIEISSIEFVRQMEEIQLLLTDFEPK